MDKDQKVIACLIAVNVGLIVFVLFEILTGLK